MKRNRNYCIESTVGKTLPGSQLFAEQPSHPPSKLFSVQVFDTVWYMAISRFVAKEEKRSGGFNRSEADHPLESGILEPVPEICKGKVFEAGIADVVLIFAESAAADAAFAGKKKIPQSSQ